MLANYTWCILLFTKEADEMEHAYLALVHSMFDGSYKILKYKGTEFKNKFLEHVTSTLGIKQVFSFLPEAIGMLRMYINF